MNPAKISEISEILSRRRFLTAWPDCTTTPAAGLRGGCSWICFCCRGFAEISKQTRMREAQLQLAILSRAVSQAITRGLRGRLRTQPS